MFRVFIIIALICSTFAQEPVACENKFEYVYNVIEKLVELGNGHVKQDSNIEQLETKLEDALKTIDELNSRLNNLPPQASSSGSTYVRWGKATCPSGAQIVYDGFAAGSYYNFAGNGANFLCLPRNPIWDIADTNIGPSSIHGVDYKIGEPYNDHEAPCVVCWIPRTSSRMIPARNECHDGWKLEYRGKLAASNEGHHRSEYICLDEDMETVGIKGNSDGNGAYLYYVESRCGSLPCDVYPQGQDLTCAVCSYSPKQIQINNP